MKPILVFLFTLFLFGITSLSGQSITAMSYNIRYDNPNDNENWWENRKSEVAELINNYQPDILGIQEGLLHQVNYILSNSSSYNYVGSGRDDGVFNGEFCALYFDTTKLELVDHNTFWLSNNPENVSVGWDAAMERICTYGHFKLINTSKNIYVFNAHFDHIGEKARKKSAKLILATIVDLGISDSALIVMGDFNSMPNSKPISVLTKKLDDPVKVLGNNYSGPAGTFNNFDPDVIPMKRIDYILTSNINIAGYSHIDDRRKNSLCVSDHLPVLIELKY